MNLHLGVIPTDQLGRTSLPEIYHWFQLLSLHGQSKDALAKTQLGAWEYDIVAPLYKCNMTDIMASIGLKQLERYPGLLARRREIIAKYDAVCDELSVDHIVAKHIQVIGFDINKKRVDEYAHGIDATNEVGPAIKNTTVDFTSDASRLKEAKFIIVAVPTPVNKDTTPDLKPVEGASRTVGQNITPGTIVVFESTVYPGVTEDVCVPIIEKESGLKCGVDWKIGYSPERINPGDRVHTLTTIRKVVSGMDEESAAEIKKVYDIVIKAGTVPVSNIKTAEAVKVVENSQRDINIAFMNEIAIICDKQ